MSVRFFLFLTLLFFPLYSHADQAPLPEPPGLPDLYELPPLIIKGSATDVLLYDPVTPSEQNRVGEHDSSGTLGRQIENQLPLPVTDNGLPGVTTQVRGLGTSVQDTDIQTLGIPLNPPNGGGFDFATFPPFLWSRYEYHFGPATGAFDPRGNVSTLTLRPWTSDALASPDGQGRIRSQVSDVYSSNHLPNQPRQTFLNETAAGIKQGPIAALLGYSAGAAQGPSGSASAHLYESKPLDLEVHLLASSLRTVSPGSVPFPTLLASLQSTRWIPVLESRARVGNEIAVKSSVYFDRNDLSYHNPDPAVAYSSFTRAEQWGAENALVWREWTLGLAARAVSFREEQVGAPTVATPTEGVFHLQLGRTIQLGSLLLNPLVEGNDETHTGWRPALSLGARLEFTPETAFYTRASYAFNFPTLNDRFYNVPGQNVATPGLTPEQVTTGTAGVQFKVERFESRLEGLAVVKRNSLNLVLLPTFESQIVNAGHASELSLLHTIRFNVLPMWDIRQSLRFSRSFVEATQEGIPYDPGTTEVLETSLHAPGDTPAWRVATQARAVSRPASTLPTGLGPLSGRTSTTTVTSTSL